MSLLSYKYLGFGFVLVKPRQGCLVFGHVAHTFQCLFFKAKGLGQTLVLVGVDTLYICGSSTSVILPSTAPYFFRGLSRLSLLWSGYLGYPDPVLC